MTNKASVNNILDKIGYNDMYNDHPPTRIIRLPNIDKTPGTKILVIMTDTKNQGIGNCKNAKKLRKCIMISLKFLLTKTELNPNV